MMVCVAIYAVLVNTITVADNLHTAKQYALSLGSNDAQSPFIGIRFSYGQMEAYLNEWMVWRECLANGQITEQEYLDWKWNWHI